MEKLLGLPNYFKVPDLPLYVCRDSNRVYVAYINNHVYRCYPLNIMKGEYLSVAYNDESFSIHRLKAMAFLPLPEGKTFSDMVVNHKNGIKYDNNVDNIEWSTYSDNLNHAFDTGLRNDNMPVFVNDLLMNRIIKFRSIAKAKSYIGCGNNAINYSLYSDKPTIIFLRYLVAFKESDLFKITRENVYKYSRRQKPMALLDKETGKEIYFSTKVGLEEYIGRGLWLPKVITGAVKDINNRYSYRVVTDFEEMHKAIKLSKAKRKESKGTGFLNTPNKVEVRFPDGKLVIFENLRATAKALKVGYSAIQKRLSKKYNGKWKGHKLRYVKTAPH